MSLVRKSIRAFAVLLSVTVGAPAAFATIEIRELPVPRSAIYAGDLIGGEMLVGKPFRVDTNARLTVHDSVEHLTGKIARRTLLPGQLIPLNAVKHQDIVKLGRPVALVFEAEGLIISAVGVALQSGGPGDFISVQNPDTGVTLKGVIHADGSVRLGGQ